MVYDLNNQTDNEKPLCHFFFFFKYWINIKLLILNIYHGTKPKPNLTNLDIKNWFKINPIIKSRPHHRQFLEKLQKPNSTWACG